MALLLHAVALYGAVYTPKGLDLGFFNVLSLTTWFIAMLVIVSANRSPVVNLGIVVLPLAAFGVALQWLFPSQGGHITHTSTGLDIHILLSIISYSLLAVAAVQAILLAVQDHHLRNRRPGGFIRALPPLETMEKLLFRMIGIGYVLLSLSLVSGVHFLEDIFAQHKVHKTTLSIVAWAVFAVLLWGRWRSGWRGRVAIRWTLAGFAILMLAYFGSKLVQELILQR
ncbi:MAG TPA: cytochrome c biogenesis protein CcsA [Gammaproteobacteria bacterium]